MTSYVGTSSARADYLLALGWDAPVAALDLAAASAQARLHASTDGGEPVLLTQGVSRGRACFRLHAVLEHGRTPRERLGLPETAGIVDVLSGILDNAHQAIRRSIDIGQGHANPELPTFSQLRDAHAHVRDTHRAARDKLKNFYRKVNHHIDRGAAAAKRAWTRGGAAPNGATKPAGSAVRPPLLAGPAPAAKQPRRPRAAPAATPGATAPAAKPRVARVPRVPKPKVAKAPRVPKVARVPRAKPFGPGNPNPNGTKSASAPIRVSGTMNGVKSTTTVHPGSSYSLVHTPHGTVLKRPGGTGVFLVHPNHVHRL